MKIMISPAKKMQVASDFIEAASLPVYWQEADRILQNLKQYSPEELRELFGANEEITRLNYQRYQEMDLQKDLTPAVLAYVGLQYQSMAPGVFSSWQWNYVKKHLAIISGFYGILGSCDGVVPYRLEMQAKLPMGKAKNLYQFWGARIYEELVKEDTEILNLASKEYSKVVEPYLEKRIRFITCTFGHELDGKVKVKATEAKMARGSMVRWMAEHQVEDLDGIKKFSEMNFTYHPGLSTETNWVFLK